MKGLELDQVYMLLIKFISLRNLSVCTYINPNFKFLFHMFITLSLRILWN